MISESNLVTAIQETITKRTDLYPVVIKTHGNNMFVKGTPDLICSIGGRVVVIEAKVNGNKPTDKQLYELDRWAKSGAVALVVTDADIDILNVYLNVILFVIQKRVYFPTLQEWMNYIHEVVNKFRQMILDGIENAATVETPTRSVGQTK